jgi:membrane protein
MTERAEAPSPARIDAENGSRGRRARRPGKIPAKGWKDVLLRVKDEVADDNLSIVAGGVAFYVLLSLFPALAAAVAIYGLVADPAAVPEAIANLSGVLPPSALGLVEDQLQGIVESAPSALGWGAVVSVLLALWSASKGSKALIAGVNLAYDEDEDRGFLKVQGLSLLFTLGIVIGSVVSVGLIAFMPSLIDRLGLGVVGTAITFVLHWLFLFAMIQVALNLVYRFAPNREDARWRWVTLGSFVVGGLWIAASGLFSWYAASFASFNETYGAISGVIVLLLWLQITFFLILLGAELNAELEHQTAIDSTTGPPEPMGERGAYMADTLGERRGE